MDRLPIRSKLVERGVDLDSILCPLYHDATEDVLHLFIQCTTTNQIWRRVSLWLALDIHVFLTMRDTMDWIDARPNVRQQWANADSIFSVVIWVLWTFHNGILFRSNKL